MTPSHTIHTCLILLALVFGAPLRANPNATVARDAQINQKSQQTVAEDVLQIAIDDFFELATGRTYLPSQANAQAEASFRKLPRSVHEEFAMAVVKKIDGYEDPAKPVRIARTAAALMAEMPEESAYDLLRKVNFAKRMTATWPQTGEEFKSQVDRITREQQALSSAAQAFYGVAYKSSVASNEGRLAAQAAFAALPQHEHLRFIASVLELEQDFRASGRAARQFRAARAISDGMPESTATEMLAKRQALQNMMAAWTPADRQDRSNATALEELRDADRRLQIKLDRLTDPLVPLALRESASEFATRCREGYGKLVDTLTGRSAKPK